MYIISQRDKLYKLRTKKVRINTLILINFKYLNLNIKFYNTRRFLITFYLINAISIFLLYLSIYKELILISLEFDRSFFYKPILS